MASANFYKCQSCDVYFATMAAANQHTCFSKEAVPSTSQPMYRCATCQSIFKDLQTFTSSKHKCNVEESVDESEDSTMSSLNTSSATAVLWDRPQTLLLIENFKKHQNALNTGKLRKKKLWEKVAVNMEEYGHTFTWEQIAGRWKSLLRAYKNVKDNNKKSGSNNKTYEYESELDEIFLHDPAITPEFTMATMSDSIAEKRKHTDHLEEELEDEDENVSSSAKKRKRATTNTEMISVFKQYIEDQKNDWKKREEMHKERMGVMTSLVDVLKNMKDSK